MVASLFIAFACVVAATAVYAARRLLPRLAVTKLYWLGITHLGLLVTLALAALSAALYSPEIGGIATAILLLSDAALWAVGGSLMNKGHGRLGPPR